MAAERRHLLADDDLGAQAAVAGDRPGRDGRVDPLVVGDRDDVEVGQALDVVEDRLDAGRAVAGERVDVEVRAAEPRRGVGHAAAPSAPGHSSGPAPAAPPAARGLSAALGRRYGRLGLEVRPDREEDRPPLVGGVGDEVLERGGEAGHRGRHPFAARPVGGNVDRDDLAAEPAVARPPDGHRVGRDARLDREHGGAHRHQGGCPEERDRRPAAGQVAVPDEADRDAVAERVGELAAGLAQADQADPGHAARALEVRLEPRHRRWSPSASPSRRPGTPGR